jgi:DNA-directed RNA polymerase subunit RPC12/RpoP
MPTKYRCPGCGAEVLVPNKAAAVIGRDEEIGCGNEDEHDNGKALVMWEADQ